MTMRRGGGAGAPQGFGETMNVSPVDGLGGFPFLLHKASLGFGFGLGRGLVVLLGSGTRFGCWPGRSPNRCHANELNGSLPFDDVTERLCEDVCTLGFGSGIGYPKDLSFLEIVQPRDVDSVSAGQVSHGRVLASLDDLVGALVVLDEVEHDVPFKDGLPQVE